MGTPGNWDIQQHMLARVAQALGPDLLPDVAFVGGCTTGLLMTDAVSREAVRFTEDVDLIVHVMGLGSWYRLQQLLAGKGFRTSPNDDVVCRTRLRDQHASELIVDFMPDDAAVLGFSNRWYADALREAYDHALPTGVTIRVVAPAYFLGTKLEAYRGAATVIHWPAGMSRTSSMSSMAAPACAMRSRRRQRHCSWISHRGSPNSCATATSTMPFRPFPTTTASARS
ncbi:hypothetical protein [Xanthomonas oryzae]|uniref:hypothetical protein n=1 Tax=Xanthomonas oryzae TaxID=347 RepID=UPI000ACA5105|nr:hypothetical protein [Xanthomonas oryzae]